MLADVFWAVLLHKEHQFDCCLRVIPIEIINESNNESQKIKRNSYLGTEKKSTATTNGPSRLEVISFKALPRKYE